MGFEQSPELKATLAKIREIVDRDLIPLERTLFHEGFDAVLPALTTVRARAREAGLFAPFLPVIHGGMGMRLSEFAYVSEVLGRTPLGHYAFHCQAPDVGNMELLLEFGSDMQKEKFLAPLLKGDIRSCFAMTEPEHAGSNPVFMGTRAVLDGNEWVINGHKWFTTSADGSEFAIVMAVTEPDAAPHMRASQILVPMSTPGVQLVRNVQVMGHPGSGWASHAELRFEGVRVPKENLLGLPGAGFHLAQARLGPGRIHHCMRWMGICQRAFELMCQRAVDRDLSPERNLASRQIVQVWVAESRAEIDAARMMVLNAAETIDKHGTDAAKNEISLIKFYTAGVLAHVVDRALQVHGALGVTDETPLAFWYREERASRIYDGPDEVHKISVAKRILRGFTPRGDR